MCSGRSEAEGSSGMRYGAAGQPCANDLSKYTHLEPTARRRFRHGVCFGTTDEDVELSGRIHMNMMSQHVTLGGDKVSAAPLKRCDVSRREVRRFPSFTRRDKGPPVPLPPALLAQRKNTISFPLIKSLS